MGLVLLSILEGARDMGTSLAVTPVAVTPNCGKELGQAGRWLRTT